MRRLLRLVAPLSIVALTAHAADPVLTIVGPERMLTLSAAPLRLVVPGDKRGARWARMVSSIEIVPVGAKP